MSKGKAPSCAATRWSIRADQASRPILPSGSIRRDETGIEVDGADTLVTGNFVTDSVKPSPGFSQGIFLIGSLGATNVNVLNNTVSNVHFCIDYANGATGIYASNTVTACGTNFSGGTAGQQGNNF
jgi:hypothetical protein